MSEKKTKRKYKNYVKTFCRQVKNDFPQIITTEELPVLRLTTTTCFVPAEDYIINLFEKLDLPAPEEEEIDGFFSKDGNYIIIFNYKRKKSISVKRIIRHECLHFLLCNSGLEYKDTSTAFIILSQYYKATIVDD